MDPAAISSLLADAGPWVLLVVSLMVGWLVPKWAHEALKDERDYWKAHAMRLAEMAEKTTDIAEKTTRTRAR